ncbi:ATP-binding protein [Dactylosporangium sp. NPDC051541]|uniref:sensor histidine kinase n=1 Tax=Dactylosporangium sp. NPDC051541 TaxID=3363977 RepID=UPI0037893BF5
MTPDAHTALSGGPFGSPAAEPALPMDRLLRIAATATTAPTVIAVVSQGEGALTPIGAHGLDRLVGGDGGPALPHALLTAVLTTGLPIIVNDAATDHRCRDPRPGDAAPAAFAGFPIRDRREEPIGAVALLDRRARTWTTRELDITDEIAQLVSAAHPRCTGRPGDGGDTAFLVALLDTLDTGVAACGPDGRLRLFNRALRDMLGAEPGATGPADWAARFIVNDLDGHPMPGDAMPLARALRGERTRGVEQLVGPRQRHVLVNGLPIISADGTRLGAVAAVHDISLRRQAERLAECELQVCYALADAEDIATAGAAVLRIVGAAFGWSCGQLWLADDGGDVLRCAATWSADAHCCPEPPPAILGRGDGHAGRAWKTNAAVWEPGDIAHGGSRSTALALPIRDGDSTVGVLAFTADTAQEPGDPVVALLSGIAAHVGQFLHRTHAEALRLDLAAARDEYLGLIGHELRSPLTVISTYLELLTADLPADHPQHDDLRSMLDAVERNAGTLRRIIDQLIDLAALDAGQLVVHRVPIDLAALVRAAATAGSGAVTVTGPASIVVPGDRDRLRQVIDHLLGNAVLYSPGGGPVEVAVHTDGDHATVTVADRGIGIDPDELTVVFGRFQRGRNVRHQGYPGAGLGLSLSRSVAEQHGGSLRLDGRNGGGTVATLTLPTADRT